MTMITPSYLGETIEYSSLHACRSTLEDPTAFKDKPTLLYDNCSTQLYLGASSYETAERISKSLGEWTQVVQDYGTNESQSWQGNSSGGQMSRGHSQNYKESGRALLRPEEILAMSDDYLIAFLRGRPPILAQRVKWYQDPAFNPAVPRRQQPPWRWWMLVAAAGSLIVWALSGL